MIWALSPSGWLALQLLAAMAIGVSVALASSLVGVDASVELGVLASSMVLVISEILRQLRFGGVRGEIARPSGPAKATRTDRPSGQGGEPPSRFIDVTTGPEPLRVTDALEALERMTQTYGATVEKLTQLLAKLETQSRTGKLPSEPGLPHLLSQVIARHGSDADRHETPESSAFDMVSLRVEVLTRVALAHVRAGELQPASRTLEKALALASEEGVSDEAAARLLVTYGATSARLGHPAHAIAWFYRASRLVD